MPVWGGCHGHALMPVHFLAFFDQVVCRSPTTIVALQLLPSVSPYSMHVRGAATTSADVGRQRLYPHSTLWSWLPSCDRRWVVRNDQTHAQPQLLHNWHTKSRRCLFRSTSSRWYSFKEGPCQILAKCQARGLATEVSRLQELLNNQAANSEAAMQEAAQECSCETTQSRQKWNNAVVTKTKD
eukprot:3407676-Amphidinium_carterae.1